MTHLSYGIAATDWKYDLQGRTVQQTETISGAPQPSYTTLWTYDAMDRLRTMTYPDSEQVTATYGKQGQQTLNPHVSAASYYPAGSLRSVSLASNATISYTYDLNQRLTSLYTAAGVEPIQNLQYRYDGVGNVLTITDAVRSEISNFQYDDLDRLWMANVTGESAYTASWGYNPIGNMTRAIKDGATTDYYYNDSAHKHAVTQAGVPVYGYDANGNMTSRGADTLTYDAENRLTQVVAGGTTTGYTYAGDGRRVKKTVTAGGHTTTTYYVGNYYEVEVAPGPVTTATSYYYFGSLRVAMRRGSEQPVYLYGDHLGSSSVTTTDNGAFRGRHTYHAYGTIRTTEGTVDTDYKFTGQKQDGNGLMFYQARYYEPALGRFVQPDSTVPNPYDPQSLNRYTYGLNNPLRYKDRSGHIPIDWLIDFFSVCFDVQQFVSQPSWENAGWLAADVVLGVVPYVPAGVGPLAKGAKLAGAVDKSADAVKIVNRAHNVAETAKAVDAGVAAYRGMRGGGIHSATTGKAFSDWFKANALKNPAAKGKQVTDLLGGERRLDIVDEAGTLVADGSKQIYELKNYTEHTSIGKAFWEQAGAYLAYANKEGYTLNYVFGQKIGDDVAEGLIERNIKVWYIDDAGKMVEWIP